MVTRSDRRSASKTRKGAATIWLLFALSALLAAFAVAINETRLWCLRTALQNAADASALAATATLVDDDLLRGNPAYLPALLQRSTAAGQQFAQLNVVQGQPLVLQPNPTNFADGDLVFCTLDSPQTRQFIAAQNISSTSNTALTQVNSVRIAAQLTAARGNAPQLLLGSILARRSMDVIAASAAMLDRDVIGFRPWDQQPLPLAPLALLSDPTGSNPLSWQYQVELKKGKDQYRFDRANQVFVADPAGDGLYEMSVVLALEASQTSQANVSILFLGGGDIAGAVNQLATGITSNDLSSLGGGLVLRSSDNRLPVAGTTIGPADSSSTATQLYQQLNQLRQSAKPLIWPLYCGQDSGSGNPILCGFVAARVVQVTPISSGQPLQFILQPTMISNSSALTSAAQRGIGGIAITNPYVCKVRLVE